MRALCPAYHLLLAALLVVVQRRLVKGRVSCDRVTAPRLVCALCLACLLLLLAFVVVVACDTRWGDTSAAALPFVLSRFVGADPLVVVRDAAPSSLFWVGRPQAV